MDLSKKNGVKVVKVHKDLPSPPFTMAFVGPSRSGKSNVIRNLLLRKNYYYNKFDYVFIFSPSIEFNGDFDEIKSNKKQKIVKFDAFDEGKISEIMNKQADVIRQHGQKNAGHILVLLDDVFDDPAFTNSSLLKTLTMRGRHLLISLMMSGQKLTLMGRPVRNNLTHLVFFRPGNFKEMDFFIDENIPKSRKKDFEKAFKEVWAKKYNFVFIDYLNPDLSKRYREGFSKSLGLEI
jgi:hypothetical protein